jgi:hypothetical protein
MSAPLPRGGNAIGDSTSPPPNSTDPSLRSPVPTRPHPDPVSPLKPLPIEPRLAQVDHATEEIRGIQEGGVDINSAAPVSSFEEELCGPKESMAQGQLPRSEPSTLLFPDLARDLHLLNQIQEERRNSRLEAADRDTPDPLVLDLLQWLPERIPDGTESVHGTSKTPLDTSKTPPASGVSRATGQWEMCFTYAEKEKWQQRVQAGAAHSSFHKPVEDTSIKMSWGHHRVAGNEYNDGQAAHSAGSSRWEGEPLTPRHQLQEDEQGFRAVKSPYWWRKESKHSSSSPE